MIHKENTEMERSRWDLLTIRRCKQKCSSLYDKHDKEDAGVKDNLGFSGLGNSVGVMASTLKIR